MEHTFIGLEDLAQELGISESKVRAKAISGEFPCYGFVSYNTAEGTQSAYLPPWDEDKFPYQEWDDFGTPIDEYLRLHDSKGRKLGRAKQANLREGDELRPRYELNGWFRLSRSVYQNLLAGKDVNLNGYWVWVFDDSFEETCPVQIHGAQVWFPDSDGGHFDRVATVLKPQDCFFALPDFKADLAPQETLTPDLRRDARQTYAAVIGALWHKAHGEGGPGKLSRDPWTAATSIADFLATQGILKPSADKIGRILSDEVSATGIKIGSSEKAD